MNKSVKIWSRHLGTTLRNGRVNPILEQLAKESTGVIFSKNAAASGMLFKMYLMVKTINAYRIHACMYVHLEVYTYIISFHLPRYSLFMYCTRNVESVLHPLTSICHVRAMPLSMWSLFERPSVPGIRALNWQRRCMLLTAFRALMSRLSHPPRLHIYYINPICQKQS